MKRIECVIRPVRLEAVKTALGELGVTGLTVSDVRGTGGAAGMESPMGRGYSMTLPPKIKIEIVTRDEDVEEVVQTVLAHARTGDPGDGVIWVLPAATAIRIRTGDEGEGVL
uniref:Nitrogen regulatory protein P-II n=1 Tax=uncultured Armatimonadetes bacterium TaxID=157466 RepID=A0A6J4IQT9_9BACT|nr:Nitrogen regulatory protein P-II [uncultured Armatimonadetes bacterium]